MAEVGGGSIAVRVGDGAVVRAAPAGAAGGPALGSPALLGVRPEAAGLLPAGGVSPAAVDALPGRVLGALFEGGRVRYEVEAAGGAVLRADVPTLAAEALTPPGTSVSVAFTPADTRLLDE